MDIYDEKPNPFFDVVIHDFNRDIGLWAAHSDYEAGKHRTQQLADYLMESLPEFALKYSEYSNLTGASAVRLLKEAALAVYTSDKYKSRGEFGELLLHVLLRAEFGSIPAASKLYYKTSSNDTVKGFDSVHVVESKDGLELWLGEVKFYKSYSDAIRDLVPEIRVHADFDYMKNEFIFIANKIDDNWRHSSEVKSLLKGNTSLDKTVKRITIPALITYESKVIQNHQISNQNLINDLTTEFEKIYSKFSSHELPPIKIVFLLIPLEDKQKLVTKMDERLKGYQ